MLRSFAKRLIRYCDVCHKVTHNYQELLGWVFCQSCSIDGKTKIIRRQGGLPIVFKRPIDKSPTDKPPEEPNEFEYDGL